MGGSIVERQIKPVPCRLDIEQCREPVAAAELAIEPDQRPSGTNIGAATEIEGGASNRSMQSSGGSRFSGSGRFYRDAGEVIP